MASLCPVFQDESSSHFLLYCRIILLNERLIYMCITLIILLEHRIRFRIQYSGVGSDQMWRNPPFTESLTEKTSSQDPKKHCVLFCLKTKLLISYACSPPSSLTLYRAISLNSNFSKLRVMTKCGRSGQTRESNKNP